MISEAAVIAVAAALYLMDCVVLLERGQALWSPGTLTFGSVHYQVRGKVVALLNPLTPFVPVFRTLPLFSTASNVKLSRALHALRPAVVLSLLQLALVFAALPYCLYRAPGWPFFISVLLAYAIAITMLGLIWWRFRGAGVATRPLFAIGFAWLACLPLSVNALRKAGLAFDVGLDAQQAIRMLPLDERQRARGELVAQIVEAMQELEEDDQRHERMAMLRRQLIPEAERGRI